jgi:hypothetical protein
MGHWCPACDKIWLASEKRKMVECDGCHIWSHCACDGIDDVAYRQLEEPGSRRALSCHTHCFHGAELA